MITPNYTTVADVEFDTLTYKDKPLNIGHVLRLEDDQYNIRTVRVVGPNGITLFEFRSDLDQWGTWQSGCMPGRDDKDGEWLVAWEHGTRPFLRPLIEALEWLTEWEPVDVGDDED